MNQTPFLVALRALGRVSIGLRPSSNNYTLRESVSPHEAKLPIEKLCYLILKRQLYVAKKVCRGVFESPTNRPDPRIQAALDRLAAVGPTGQVSVKELALSVKLSPARFSHLFALATGLPPARYIKRAKHRSSHQIKARDK